MTTDFRIYGDNIIECFRIINLLRKSDSFSSDYKIIYENTSTVIILLNIKDSENIIKIELIPGFDKSNKKRWTDNILDVLKSSGGDLDETADAILTGIDKKGQENILCIIEFCSALQAGNQAWQRSGRAYSIGKTDIPYLYIVDFTRYELDSKTRKRKNLRFPNAVVPYSYITYTSLIKTPVLQSYFRSEEFEDDDRIFKDVDFSTIFSESDVSQYLSSLMLDKETNDIISKLKKKNLEMVYFLANLQNDKSSLNRNKIKELDPNDLYNSLIKVSDIGFKKIIAEKSVTGKIKELNDLASKYSIGVFSSSLPFGIIPKKNISAFTTELNTMYGFATNKLENCDGLIVTFMKGFKPAGDDNRPDRGILPLIRMLFGEKVSVLTILYGPIIGTNYSLLKSDQKELANRNGLWQTIIYMSDFLIIDSPIIKHKTLHSAQELLDLKHNKFLQREIKIDKFKKLDITPIGFREDDVDTVLYTLFTNNFDNAFVGLCNPPGGDWSGFSIINDLVEYRWLSLPRVSISGYKRPDHVIEFFTETKPILLIIESKDRHNDLESNIGPRLEGYIKWLLNYTPNVENKGEAWELSKKKVNSSDYIMISCGSFIDAADNNHLDMLKTSNCDMIISFQPNIYKEWNITIYHNNKDETVYVANQIVKRFQEATIIKNIKLVN